MNVCLNKRGILVWLFGIFQKLFYRKEGDSPNSNMNTIKPKRPRTVMTEVEDPFLTVMLLIDILF